MQADFLGSLPPALPIGYQPAAGHWVMFHLEDLARQAELVKLGAHAARDGSLVAIFCAPQVEPVVEAIDAEGVVTRTGGGLAPAMLVLVDANGNNFSVPVRDKQSGHGAWKDVMFYPASVKEIRPLTDMADMPPGRVVHPDWSPSAKIEPRPQLQE